MAAKVMHGARAVVRIGQGDNLQIVGIFNNVSYGLAFDAQPSFILGRFSAADIDYTAQEVVNITASGWRVYGAGPHEAPRVPHLQDLLAHEYLTFEIHDRQNPNGKPLMQVTQVRPTGYSGTIAARALSEVTINFVGILVNDESEDNGEPAGATQLP